MRNWPIFLLAVPAWAAVSNVQVTGVTNTQSAIRYTAPTTHACRVEVSESPAYVPLVHDANPVLFNAADSDARPEAWRHGLERVFVAGKRTVEKAADNRRYSRALKADTLHYFRITCGSDTAAGTFATANIPFGLTTSDPVSAIGDEGSQGYYNFPSLDHADRNETIIDPLTGALIRKLTKGRDTVPPSGTQNVTSCSGSNWVSPEDCDTTYSGTTRDPLFAKNTPWSEVYLHKVNVFMKAGISGSPAGEDKYIDVCLTLDGTTCASGKKTVDLTTCSTSSVQGDCNGFGSTSNANVFYDTWGGTEFPLVGWTNQATTHSTGFLVTPRTNSGSHTITIKSITYTGQMHFMLDAFPSATDMKCGVASITDNGDGQTYYLCHTNGYGCGIYAVNSLTLLSG